MDLKQFKQLPILGILRGISADIIEPLIETVVASGLETIEITMDTPGAAQLLPRIIKLAQGRLTVGAGTVLTMDDLREALDAGATFIVSPTFVPRVVEYCTKNKIAVFPGALTPQEIHNAWRAGATMVKVFPAKCFGPAYFKAIKGPFKDLELLACGGVNKENIRSFFLSGASAVAFGASIFKKEWLINSQFLSIKEGIQALIKEFNGI